MSRRRVDSRYPRRQLPYSASGQCAPSLSFLSSSLLWPGRLGPLREERCCRGGMLRGPPHAGKRPVTFVRHVCRALMVLQQTSSAILSKSSREDLGNLSYPRVCSRPTERECGEGTPGRGDAVARAAGTGRRRQAGTGSDRTPGGRRQRRRGTRNRAHTHSVKCRRETVLRVPRSSCSCG
jgi:hypothetical protein